MKQFNSNQLILSVALFITAFANISFFEQSLQSLSANNNSWLFIGSLAIVLCGVNVILLSIFSHRSIIKPVLIFFLICSAFAAYFMDSYHIIIDGNMLNNTLKTDPAEIRDLLSIRMLGYFLLLGLLPAVLVLKTGLINPPNPPFDLLSRIKLMAITMLVMLITMFAFSSNYTSFFREHKELRFYTNPASYLYGTSQYLSQFISAKPKTLQRTGVDAKIPDADTHRELIIFVVGEAVRADHMSLNGYDKPTNPQLEKEKNLINFSNVWSCGTSTAVSVPCMFSNMGRNDFSNTQAKATENALDVFRHAGVNVLWLDNNSDSKGVADRSENIDYKHPATNPDCDTECRDIGMLRHLQNYIDKHPKGDIFIVLHQMGNHGPAYYKRYPQEFEFFKPVCRTNALEQCGKEEIRNAYDNAIRYTDDFLVKTIALLKQNSKKFEAGMLYISDHGESLGENNIYLHGLPYLIAPDAQKHVPMLMWFSDSFEDINVPSLRKMSGQKYSQDNIFHTLLGLMEINSVAYKPELDIMSEIKKKGAVVDKG